MKRIVTSTIFLLIAGCTAPGETTGVGATAGGVIGAGLGAIVGSQTGNAGSGLVIGAAAGTATGAMVGNALQAQNEAIQTQDEAIERQERTIRTQRSELNELRRMNQDGPSPTTQQKIPPFASNSGLKERDLTVTQPTDTSVDLAAVQPSSVRANQDGTDSGRYRYDWKNEAAKKTNKDSTAASVNCAGSSEELQSANRSVENADKLYHLRRALRICPDSPELHLKLGEVYESLNRRSDADYEYKEALKLNPDYKPAQQALNR